jgi:hypothetical protein
MKIFHAILLSLLLVPCTVSHAEDGVPESGDFHFYRKVDYGSESQFNPVSSFINYSLDSLQAPDSFGYGDFDGQFDETLGNLLDPFDAIDESGGTWKFINRQIAPIDPDNIEDAREAIPNYALHLFGGGMVYRKNLEWYQYHGFSRPGLLAALSVMAAELSQEILEKKSTTPDDEVADFHIFRPAGIVLFSFEPVVHFASGTLGLVEWPYQPMYDPGTGKPVNVGENFAIRPVLFGTERHAPFLYFGFTTLAGISHRINDTDSASWGIGGAIERAERDYLGIRPSGGLFYDRNDSLLGSLILNGTDALAVRLNVYPGVTFLSRWSPGVFVGIGDNGDVIAGASISIIPIGISGTLAK